MNSKCTTELAGATFEFFTMNVNRLSLFQVYVPYEGKKHRFHMQLRGGEFLITDPDKVPEPYRGLQPELSAAIFANNPAV